MAYNAEEEQELEQLKSWWKDNYVVIILAVVVTFAGVFGWRYWQAHQANKIQEISAEYDRLIYGNQGIAAKEAQLSEFLKNNEKTSYAVLALLDQAKQAVENKDFAQAEKALKQATQESDDHILQSIVAIRLAAVEYQQGKYDAALESLHLVKDAAWNSRKHLMTGDIWLAKGDKMTAKASYELAKEHATPLEQQWLQVRLNNL
ncbi:YfgM family protein [Conservatibacter flavescens]|uniref:Ancillary SecYEG translocon subunit n=1 Tax=Conservatibacter flavescens TaxID=28161 RepID=A0A2M8S0L2_9PAST|nr:tetratricopeptide repeat protein [Conservatibacter flavescens]PJG84690.1 hypothetical protein CVP05_10485 [Conservatibacter flavescens]